MRSETPGPLREREPAASEVDAAAFPLLLRESAKAGQHFAAPPLERGERRAGIAPRILAVLRPLVRVERVLRDETPGRELPRGGAEHEDRRLVEGEDRVEACLEELLDVAQVAEDLGGRPLFRLRPSRERGLVTAGDEVLQIIRRLRQPPQHRFAGPGGVVVEGRRHAVSDRARAPGTAAEIRPPTGPAPLRTPR